MPKSFACGFAVLGIGFGVDGLNEPHFWIIRFFIIPNPLPTTFAFFVEPLVGYIVRGFGITIEQTILQTADIRGKQESHTIQLVAARFHQSRQSRDSKRFITVAHPDRTIAALGDFFDLFEHTTGAIRQNFVSFELVLFEEVLKLFWFVPLQKLLGEFSHFVPPGDLGLWRFPLADAVKVVRDRRPTGEFVTNCRDAHASKRISEVASISGVGEKAASRSSSFNSPSAAGLPLPFNC